MSSLFGWSLPPGCGALPGEEDYPCEVCGRFDDHCICPECPECGEVGRPTCYTPKDKGGCGCIKSAQQIASLAAEEAKWEEQNRVEAEMDGKIEID